MAVSQAEQEFVAQVVDLLQAMGPVTAKGMFGGHGIFLDGLMFALVADRVLYLKVDEQNQADFVSRDLAPFSYSRAGRVMKMGYFQAPEEALEDAELLRAWAGKAYEVALRAKPKKKPKKAK